ncbi:hypothetical protein ACIBL3_19300 [Kribbella sp. NPDC050124]
MRQIRITKPTRTRRRQYDDLPLDPRDPDILRAKQAARRAETPPETDQIR